MNFFSPTKKNMMMKGFWSSSPSDPSSVSEGKQFYIRMQICLSEVEYRKQRPPYFVRFITKAGKMVHIPIHQYRYVGNSVLETRFYFSEPDAFPVQTPMVCFDPKDNGGDCKEEDCPHPLSLYLSLTAKAGRIRDELETKFPDCKQIAVGFMENELMLFLRLKGNFMVAVSSDSSVPIFTWDRRCLIPLEKANPKLGQGFKLTMPDVNGHAEHFWYERERVQLFTSVKKVVQYADAHVYKDGELRIDPARHFSTDNIASASEPICINVRRLSRVLPYLGISTFSRVEHAIKVYADIHWRCEVCCLGFCVVFQ
jgi:hypothetical protein